MWVDLADVHWDPGNKTLGGTAKVIGGEPFKIVVANNGHKVLEAVATRVEFDIKPHSVAGLSCLTLCSADNAELRWGLKYK